MGLIKKALALGVLLVVAAAAFVIYWSREPLITAEIGRASCRERVSSPV